MTIRSISIQNLTGSPVQIDDLGAVTVDATSTLDLVLTHGLTEDALRQSYDLRDLIQTPASYRLWDGSRVITTAAEAEQFLNDLSLSRLGRSDATGGGSELVEYTPNTGTDWSKAGGPSVDPGTVEDALDKLAARKSFEQITTDGYGNVTADGYGDSVKFRSPDGSILFDGYESPNEMLFRVGAISQEAISAILSAQTITSTDLVFTTSDVFVDMPGMAFTTTADGSYWVVYSGDLENSNNKKVTIILTLENGGPSVDIPHSERTVDLSSNKRQIFQTQGLITGVVAGDVIKVRWNTEGGIGTGKSYHRSMILLRITAVV